MINSGQTKIVHDDTSFCGRHSLASPRRTVVCHTVRIACLCVPSVAARRMCAAQGEATQGNTTPADAYSPVAQSFQPFYGQKIASERGDGRWKSLVVGQGGGKTMNQQANMPKTKCCISKICQK